MLEVLFKLKVAGTCPGCESPASVTTFPTMGYIIFENSGTSRAND